MHEDFGTILNRGFKTWVRNLNICIPYVLNFFVNLVLYVFFFAILGFLFFNSASGNVINLSTLSNEELYSLLVDGFMANIPASIASILVFSLLGLFLQSFFTAGAIGMAKKASETGDTVISDMVRFGSKNAVRFFLVNLLLTLILLAGIVFVVPGALTIGNLSGLIENPAATVQGMGTLVLGILAWGIYVLVINITLSITPYALVIDELDPLEAIKKGYSFFKENKLDVFFIWIIVVGLAFINGLVSELLGSENTLISGLTYFIPILILQPLTTVLWTRLYLTMESRELYDPYELLSDPDDF
ncbi:TPA: hypothetical protein HA338_02620 [Methanosarcina acetivorans]|uniref:DUF7847 domain-containing protein n=2 Tax=Methanosarcina acetivorans TaxID=2214 RepID=Q8TPD8_METAC|nr:hypothetical protein [Methanosarcina acetivorans]AAM05378.1 conserved hypothetical protein [Methanosarcina acetivorans C2A]HIH92961.1 hypothetical protein [Methanosarcina acetivorans]